MSLRGGNKEKLEDLDSSYFLHKILGGLASRKMFNKKHKVPWKRNTKVTIISQVSLSTKNITVTPNIEKDYILM